MRSLVLMLLLAVCRIAVAAQESAPAVVPAERAPALSFISGLPVLAYSLCSGSPVRSRQWEKPMFLSARHCFPKSIPEGEAVRGAYASGSVMGLPDPGARALEFKPGLGQFDLIQDFALVPVSGDVSPKARIYDLAQRMPQPGDMITIWGYPGVGVPLIGGAAPLTKMECSYLGPIMNGSSAKGRPFTMLHAALCPSRTFIQGMSGGPILNSSGELIGALSMSTLPRQLEGGEVAVIFPEVTEARVNWAADPARRDYLRPLADGVFPQRDMHIFKREPLAQDGGSSSLETFQQPVDTLKLYRAHYDVPLLGQLVDGVLRAYTKDGTLSSCATYREGKYSGAVSCR